MEIAEQRFIWLLKQRGCSFWGENELGEKIKTVPITKRPDFYVEDPAGRPFLVEVESFKKIGPMKGSEFSSRVMSSNPEDIYKRLRSAVKEAVEQLRPYRQLTIPMIIVLDNWRRIGMPSNIFDLRNALFGTLEVRQRIDFEEKTMEPARWHHGKGQQLNAGLATYISAVAWNLPKNRYHNDPMTEERSMYVRMIHNPFAKIPFSVDVFNNGGDEHESSPLLVGNLRGSWVNHAASSTDSSGI